MNTHNPFILHQRWHIYLFAGVVLVTGALSFRADLQGKTLGMTEMSKETEITQAEAPAPFVLPDSMMEAMLRNPTKVQPLPVEQIDVETLWLARIIYSETKRPTEQELVAWVVRNRVETLYRGKNTYRDVALDPYQFSAFNPNSRKRTYYTNLGVHAKATGWQKTLALAYHVRHASPQYRPFSPVTRHFFSERSLLQNAHPEWTVGLQPITPKRSVKLDAQRFRFYEGVM